MAASAERSRKSKIARGCTSEGEPNPIDVYVGHRISERRSALKMSLDELRKMSGLSCQQVQKYEKGDNRISASRLWDFAQARKVPIEYFFTDMDEEITSRSPRKIKQSIKS